MDFGRFAEEFSHGNFPYLSTPFPSQSTCYHCYGQDFAEVKIVARGMEVFGKCSQIGSIIKASEDTIERALENHI